MARKVCVPMGLKPYPISNMGAEAPSFFGEVEGPWGQCVQVKCRVRDGEEVVGLDSKHPPIPSMSVWHLLGVSLLCVVASVQDRATAVGAVISCMRALETGPHVLLQAGRCSHNIKWSGCVPISICIPAPAWSCWAKQPASIASDKPLCVQGGCPPLARKLFGNNR